MKGLSIVAVIRRTLIIGLLAAAAIAAAAINAGADDDGGWQETAAPPGLAPFNIGAGEWQIRADAALVVTCAGAWIDIDTWGRTVSGPCIETFNDNDHAVPIRWRPAVEPAPEPFRVRVTNEAPVGTERVSGLPDGRYRLRVWGLAEWRVVGCTGWKTGLRAVVTVGDGGCVASGGGLVIELRTATDYRIWVTRIEG